MSKKKASDYYNNSQPFIGKKVSFGEAFPQVEKVRVDVLEYKDFWQKDDGYYPVNHSCTESNFRPYVDCSESSCNGGGFNISKLLSDMVENNLPVLEDTANCIGHIGSKNGIRCVHFFKYKISVTYK